MCGSSDLQDTGFSLEKRGKGAFGPTSSHKPTITCTLVLSYTLRTIYIQTCTYLECGRKSEHLEKILSITGRSYKLCPDSTYSQVQTCEFGNSNAVEMDRRGGLSPSCCIRTLSRGEYYLLLNVIQMLLHLGFICYGDGTEYWTHQ